MGGGAFTITGLNGREGSVRIPALGTVIGRFASWTFKRRGDGGPKEGLYDLRAALSYVNPHLFLHPEYSRKREIKVRLNRTTEYLIQETENTRVKLDGNVLEMEGVKLVTI